MSRLPPRKCRRAVGVRRRSERTLRCHVCTAVLLSRHARGVGRTMAWSCGMQGMCGELKPHFPRPSHCPAAASSLCTTSPPATTPRPRSTPGACDQGRRAGKAGFGCGRRSACTALHRSHPPHSPTNARRECHPSPLVPQGCSGGVRRAVGRGAARVPVCLRAGCRAGGSGRRPGELRARLPGACAGSTARLRTFLLWYDALCSVLVRRAWLPRWKRQHGRTGSASTGNSLDPSCQLWCSRQPFNAGKLGSSCAVMRAAPAAAHAFLARQPALCPTFSLCFAHFSGLPCVSIAV